MDTERSKRKKGISHQQFRSQLQIFRPADAAFVFHLAQCSQCRGLAERSLAPQEPTPLDSHLESLSPREREIILDLTRGGYLLRLVDRAAASNDLSPVELHGFLESLRPEQMDLIRHLLFCPGCQEITTKVLAPKGTSSALNPIEEGRQ